MNGDQFGFPPVPPPLLGAHQVIGTAIPNTSGVYFIWEGSVIAYVGQSVNLGRRLLGHPHLRRSDKISYLCIDSSELLYHEAFYIGTCRPSRNSIQKSGSRKTLSHQKYLKTGHASIRVQEYSDRRWGFDDYSSGKRIMVRLCSKEKAEKRAEDIAVGLTNSRGELLTINADELAEFREWKTSIKKVSENQKK